MAYMVVRPLRYHTKDLLDRRVRGRRCHEYRCDSTDSIVETASERTPGYASSGGTAGIESVGYLGLMLDDGVRLGSRRSISTVRSRVALAFQGC